MRIVIEVVADERTDCTALLRDAVREFSQMRERSGVEVNSCQGDYRIIVHDEPDPVPPYARDARVRCLDRTSAYFGRIGSVLHCGPRHTGVMWDGETRPNIRPNADLEPA